MTQRPCQEPAAASCLRQRVNSRGWFIPSTATGTPGTPVDGQDVAVVRGARLDGHTVGGCRVTGELDLHAVLVGPEVRLRAHPAPPRRPPAVWRSRRRDARAPRSSVRRGGGHPRGGRTSWRSRRPRPRRPGWCGLLAPHLTPLSSSTPEPSSHSTHGRAPTPTTTMSPGMLRPSSSRTASTRRSPLSPPPPPRRTTALRRGPHGGRRRCRPFSRRAVRPAASGPPRRPSRPARGRMRWRRPRHR